ncbi:Uncharacterised protein [Candidatus Anstonella stagnisolia]|nr:Uncharacterised protein [Candidatus Anstonella stagnisolia]
MRKAFVFSLDAFVALMLVLLAINSAIALSSVPKGYYSSLEQAHDLAKDTLRSMHSTQYNAKLTYVDAVLVGGGDRLVAIANSAEKAIPMQFGYRFDKFNALTNTWETLYDSATDPSSSRYGKTQGKLSASYRLFFSSYENSLNRGESPFCYKSCSGVPELPPSAGDVGGITDAQATNAQIAGQQYSAPIGAAKGGMRFEGAIQANQANLPNNGIGAGNAGAAQNQQADLGNSGAIAGDAGQANPNAFENNQVNLGNTGVVVGVGGQAQKQCMSPCDVPFSLYDAGTPFIGQLRLTVYS